MKTLQFIIGSLLLLPISVTLAQTVYTGGGGANQTTQTPQDQPARTGFGADRMQQSQDLQNSQPSSNPSLDQTSPDQTQVAPTPPTKPNQFPAPQTQQGLPGGTQP